MFRNHFEKRLWLPRAHTSRYYLFCPFFRQGLSGKISGGILPIRVLGAKYLSGFPMPLFQ